MRLVGIDFGAKCIGIALSDESGAIAFPHSVVENERTTAEAVARIVMDERAEKIVMGHSRDYRGKDNLIMERARAFAGALEEKTNVPVVFEPEVLTSREAAHVQGKHEKIDASAAAIILQSYIDKQKKPPA